MRRIARARLAIQVIRRLRRAGVTGARYDARAFAIRFRQPPPAPQHGANPPGHDGQKAATRNAGTPEGLPLDTGEAPTVNAATPEGMPVDTGEAPTVDPGTREGMPLNADEPPAINAGTPMVIPLDALLASRGRRRERRAQIDRFVAGFLARPGLPHRWADVRPLLRPVLRGAVPIKNISAPLRRPALPYLSEFVVIDQPDTMTYVAADQPADWGVTAAEVFAIARANLTGAVLHGVTTDPVVVQFVDDGDAYWTSHLLLDGWLARLTEQVGGVPVAFAPERGTLIVAADCSPHLPDLFGRAELTYLTSPRAISPMAYVSDKHGHTVPYAAPPGHPLRDCVRRAESVLAMHEYARQAETLADAAPLVLADDDLRTRAVWTEGALLPLADDVVIGTEVRPWAEIAPQLEVVPDLDPPRFRRRSAGPRTA